MYETPFLPVSTFLKPSGKRNIDDWEAYRTQQFLKF
jgi:hypothetical protein